jgi:hypothetical protein
MLLGHATADDLLMKICDGLTEISIPLGNILQLSMDGPNVNWSLYTKLGVMLQKQHQGSPINIGSCGLHILNNAFKKGEVSSDWGISDFLKALWYVFNDAPARREDFEACCGGHVLFPLKFCGTRWLENSYACQKAIDILPCLKKLVEKIKKGNLNLPKCKSFETIRTCVEDMLLEPKLTCFISIAKLVEPFLREYQTDNVVLPFLCQDMERMIHSIMNIFMKPFLADTPCKLLQIDLKDVTGHLEVRKVDAGFVSEKAVKTA